MRRISSIGQRCRPAITESSRADTVLEVEVTPMALTTKRMSHGGSTIGFRTTIERFPDDALTIIILANRADLNPEDLALKVADLYLPTR